MKHLKKSIILFSLMIMLVFSGCSVSTKSVEEVNAKAFLTSFYTTNENDRYTAFCKGNATDSDIMEAFYSNMKAYGSDELFDTMEKNRLPMKYDEEYLDDPLIVDDVMLVREGDSYKFEVITHHTDEEIIFSGSVSFDEDHKVNKFYEG